MAAPAGKGHSVKLVVAGIIIILLGFVWLFSLPALDHSSPLFFRWSDFKPILGIFVIGGAAVLGVTRIQKKKKQQAK